MATSDQPPERSSESDAVDGSAPEATIADPIVEIRDVVAGYVTGVHILNGADLVVAESELVGIIGPNGAGKSTMLKALFGLVKVTSGEVTLRGEDITHKRAHELVGMGLAYVPQNDNVFPRLTVEENLEMGAFTRPRAFKERLALIVDLFPRLGERIKQRAGSLSGGERQMLAMARALMTEPEVLLLDEPSAGLSPALQDQVFVRCREINATGVTVIMVEQNAKRCLEICNRGYVLDQGHTAYTGRGADLLRDPKVIELYLGTLATAD